MLRKQITAVLAGLILVSTAVQAIEPSPQAQELMRKANAANGYMDKKLHDDFWAEVKKSVEPDPGGAKLKEAQDTLQELTLKNTTYPLEGWKSAKLSFEQKKVVRTPELVRQTKALKALGNPGLDKAMENTERMLKAAATGEKLDVNGQSVQIDEELIAKVLDGMEASLSRLMVLTNPVWTETLFEQSIPRMNLAVMTHEKFVVSPLKDVGVPAYEASRNANALQEQIATYSLAGAPNVDLDEAMNSIFTGATTSTGLKGKPKPANWKGMDGMTAHGQIEVGDRRPWISVHIFKRVKNRSILMVMTMAEGDEKDARAAQDALLKRLKLK